MSEWSNNPQAGTGKISGSPLAGRRVLVTGATSGLGETIAVQLAVNYGATVIATGRRSERLERVAARIRAANGEIQTHALDVTDTEAVMNLCERLKEEGVDDLVLNAGITSVGSFTDSTFDNDQALIDTNVSANLRLIRNLIQPLSYGKTGGRILLVASLGGLVPLPYQSVYAGSKAFLLNFGLSLREELKSHGICVLVFAPGGIATEMTEIAAMDKLRSQLADVDKVASAAIKMFIKRKSLSVPGWQNKVTAALARLLPRSTLASIAGRIYRP